MTRKTEAARARLVSDTRARLQDAVARHLGTQLEECERLPEEEVGPGMAKVAAACIEQVCFVRVVCLGLR